MSETYCPNCGGLTRAVRIDVLTGEDVLVCDAWQPCGWTSDSPEEVERMRQESDRVLRQVGFAIGEAE